VDNVGRFFMERRRTLIWWRKARFLSWSSALERTIEHNEAIRTAREIGIDGMISGKKYKSRWFSSFEVFEWHNLPKTADWQAFFDSLVSSADAEMRLRTYWYVVDEIDFSPYNLARLVRDDQATLEAILRKDRYWVAKLDGVTGPKVSVLDAAKTLQHREHSMQKRFDGWQQLQNDIAHRFDSVEFRRAVRSGMTYFGNNLGKRREWMSNSLRTFSSCTTSMMQESS
jgi:hypothetical protein